MVLVGEGGAEEGHNTVPPNLVDRTFVVVNCFHQPNDDRVQELAGLLGIAIGEQLHGALEVGEEHRDLLALAFEGRLGGEDLLGEVLGGIGLRRRERGGLTRNGLSALKAELRAGG